MGEALGGLPNRTPIAIESVSTGRKTIIVKNDIGGGGGSVEGYTRAIDLYAPVAKWLAGADCNWTGLVRWHRL
jgi:predicted ATP-grasp superfamily ATP-dependent carboligase